MVLKALRTWNVSILTILQFQKDLIPHAVDISCMSEMSPPHHSKRFWQVRLESAPLYQRQIYQNRIQIMARVWGVALSICLA